MATKMILPILGESIQTAVLAKWNYQPGDPVKRGDEIAEIETDKATMALECPANGVLLEILIPEGSQVRTGDLLAWIGRPGETVQEKASPEPAAQTIHAAPQADPQPEPEPAATRRRISPAARRMAATFGIPLDQLQPRKPGLRIMTEDVKRFLEHQQAQQALQPGFSALEKLSGRLEPLNTIRRLTGERMLASVQQIPQFSVTVEADASRLLAAVNLLNRDTTAENRITLTALLVYLTARALKQNPSVNARFAGDGIFIYDHVNMAIAVSTSRGLVAPVLSAVECLTLREVAAQFNRLVRNARDGKLEPGDLEGGTFTLSNLGPQGVSQFTAIINPPQAAILAVGAARPLVTPVASGGTRHIQSMALTLTADHRVLDGADVARFLGDLRREMETYGER